MAAASSWLWSAAAAAAGAGEATGWEGAQSAGKEAATVKGSLRAGPAPRLPLRLHTCVRGSSPGLGQQGLGRWGLE